MMTTVPERAPDLGTAAEILGPLASCDVPLGPYCTYRVGGPAALFVEPDSTSDHQGRTARCGHGLGDGLQVGGR
ncbi:MAG: hypothetical protein AAFO29_14505, partial [Actinomycetota bacterium]